jgi:branched-chain amino acid transport system permease protein
VSGDGVKVKRWDRVSIGFNAAVAVVVVLLALTPLAFAQGTTEKLTELFILILLAAMWNAMAGFGGMVSIGQQAFIGLGAYGTVVLAEHGVNGYLAVVLAALVAGAISLPVSLLAFRLRGGQFAIGMWVIAEAFRLIVYNDNGVGGGTGRSLTALNVYAPATRQAITFWLALGLTALLLGAVVLLLRGRLGPAIQAIRDDEVGAASLGVKVTFSKRILFVLAAVGCGAAGGLILANSLFVEPNSIFGVQYTAYMIFMVLIGGLGTFEGPVLGALIFFAIQQEFASHGSWYLIGLGVIAIAMTQVMPRGVWGALVDRFGIRLVPVGYRISGIGDRESSTTRSAAVSGPPKQEEAIG